MAEYSIEKVVLKSDVLNDNILNLPINSDKVALNSDLKIRFFPKKLWTIVNDPNYEDAISWSQCGQNIIINEQELMQRCLGEKNNIFKTYKLKSFIRQLHLYGFKKIAKNQYYNVNFRQGQPHLLVAVKRECKRIPKNGRAKIIKVEIARDVPWNGSGEIQPVRNECLTNPSIDDIPNLDGAEPMGVNGSYESIANSSNVLDSTTSFGEFSNENQFENMHNVCEQYYTNLTVTNNYVLTMCNNDLNQTIAYS